MKPPINFVGDMSSLLGMVASNSMSSGYMMAVMSRYSYNNQPDSLNAPIIAWLCSSALQSLDMMEPGMHIVFNLLSSERIDITTFTIETWHLDVSSVYIVVSNLLHNPTNKPQESLCNTATLSKDS
jgi:hypothetical protein